MSGGSEKYKVKWTTKLKKDYKIAKKRGYDIPLNILCGRENPYGSAPYLNEASSSKEKLQ